MGFLKLGESLRICRQTDLSSEQLHEYEIKGVVVDEHGNILMGSGKQLKGYNQGCQDDTVFIGLEPDEIKIVEKRIK